MFRKGVLLAVVALLSTTSLVHAQGTSLFSATQDNIGVTWGATYLSRYIWYGIDLFSDNHSAVQPFVSLDLWGTGWVFDTRWTRPCSSDNEVWEQIDYTLSYGGTCNEGSPCVTNWRAGWRYYNHPDGPIRRLLPAQSIHDDPFDEFGNHLWHYAVTGPAMEEVLQDELGEGERLAGLFLTSGSSGTLGCADYIKERFPQAKLAVGEAWECPTLLLNGFGGHRIEGIGDKHVPWIHNVRNTDLVIDIEDEFSMRLIRLFNEPAGQEFLVKQGVPESLVEKLPWLGISSAANLIGAIKLAKYYELTSRDIVLTVFTDSMELYESRIQELREKYGPYDERQAAIDYERFLLGITTDRMQELTYWDRRRIHNLKYYTWIEQMGKSVEELQAQWYDWPEYWDRIHRQVDEIDTLIEEFNRIHFPRHLVFHAALGSKRGLLSLAAGKSQIAGVHLFHPPTGDYNLPYAAVHLHDKSYLVINLAYRRQGLLAARDNPLDIRGVKDLGRRDIRFINRNEGSGTRYILDYQLAKEGISPAQIDGYQREKVTHMEVGLEILRNNADVGVGIEYVAELLGLCFIPLVEERFDLVTLKDGFTAHPIKDFFALLEPEKLTLQAGMFRGYDFRHSGTIIYP